MRGDEGQERKGEKRKGTKRRKRKRQESGAEEKRVKCRRLTRRQTAESADHSVITLTWRSLCHLYSRDAERPQITLRREETFTTLQASARPLAVVSVRVKAIKHRQKNLPSAARPASIFIDNIIVCVSVFSRARAAGRTEGFFTR